MKEQRRYRRIAMPTAERDEFLLAERTCRIATISSDGRPHVVPLWFVWTPSSAAMWFYSVTRSQRWRDLERNPLVSVVVDAGTSYGELRGVELSGSVEVVGEVPRIGQANAELEEPERAFVRKYDSGSIISLDDSRYDGLHGWLRLVPEKIVSWDFRKIASLS